MFRLWCKVYKENRLIKDMVITNTDHNLTRTKKIYSAIDQISYDYDISKPIWLKSNIEEFKKFSKTRFYQDNYIEEINFDYLEIHVIEED